MSLCVCYGFVANTSIHRLFLRMQAITLDIDIKKFQKICGFQFASRMLSSSITSFSHCWWGRINVVSFSMRRVLFFAFQFRTYFLRAWHSFSRFDITIISINVWNTRCKIYDAFVCVCVYFPVRLGKWVWGCLRATNYCHFSFWSKRTCHITFILLFIDLTEKYTPLYNEQSLNNFFI